RVRPAAHGPLHPEHVQVLPARAWSTGQLGVPRAQPRRDCPPLRVGRAARRRRCPRTVGRPHPRPSTAHPEQGRLRMSTTPVEELRAAIPTTLWYHTMELAPG